VVDQQDLFPTQVLPDVGGNKTILVGTSGYIFPDWRGNFYPEKLPQKRWLEFYAEHFSTVEINATYYRLPPRSTFESMVQRTPTGYPFWVKVPGEITHHNGDILQTMELFKQSITPLNESGRLAGVLAQFPFSFRPTTANFELLGHLRVLTEPVPLAVEIRHHAWQTSECAGFLRREAITNVISDLPDLPGLPAPDLLVTSKIAYIRLHGRNRLTWNNPEKGDRYDYHYSTTELAEWLPKLKALQKMSESTFIFFNNCHMGQAVRNAKMLKSLLCDQFGTIN